MKKLHIFIAITASIFLSQNGVTGNGRILAFNLKDQKIVKPKIVIPAQKTETKTTPTTQKTETKTTPATPKTETSNLATETDLTKVQALILSTDYKKITENDYIVIKKHFRELIKAVDVSTDKGKSDFAILYMGSINFNYCLSQGGAKNFTKEAQKKQADEMTVQMKGVTKEQIAPAIDQGFTTDEAKLKQEYQMAQKSAAAVLAAEAPTEENLFAASREGNARRVQDFINAKVNVNAVNKNGYTPLMLASEAGKVEVVSSLINAKANVNAKDADGNTSLMLASNGGYGEIVRILLAANAEVDAKNKYGYTALMGSSFHGKTEIARQLINAKADVNSMNADGTPLMFASQNGHVDTVKLLLESKADINAKIASGNTALINAAAEGKVEVVRFLIESKADLNIKDIDGNSAMKFAEQRGHADVAELLKSAGAKE
jgi:ankyrin repeat protein